MNPSTNKRQREREQKERQREKPFILSISARSATSVAESNITPSEV